MLSLEVAEIRLRQYQRGDGRDRPLSPGGAAAHGQTILEFDKLSAQGEAAIQRYEAGKGASK
jgi:hypothetical protein